MKRARLKLAAPRRPIKIPASLRSYIAALCIARRQEFDRNEMKSLSSPTSPPPSSPAQSPHPYPRPSLHAARARALV